MANAGVSAAVGVVAGFAIAAIAVATGVLNLPAAGGKKIVHATISLQRVSGTGSCFIVTTPQTLEAFKRETVEWSIVDHCGVLDDVSDEVTIAFKATDPLDPSCMRKGKKKIRCALNNPEKGFYAYSVSAPDATTEDPELEIVQ